MEALRPLVIVMAGGQGKRMNSSLPKVIHSVGGKPMIVRLIQQALCLDPENILLIVGAFRNQIRSEVERWIQSDRITYVDQPNPMGTGHAIYCALPDLKRLGSGDQSVIILNGDVPMLQYQTIAGILADHENSGAALTISSIELEDPTGNGRIIRDSQGHFQEIVEQKDATPEQLLIRLSNVGIYAASLSTLLQQVPRITNQNAQNEYYLTDLVKLSREDGLTVGLCILPPSAKKEIYNVNTQEQLRMLESLIDEKLDQV